MLVGLLAGVLSGLSRVHLAGPVDVYVNSIPAWLAVPFAVGAMTRRPAAVAGALASLGQLAGFYAVTGAFGSAASVAFWCVGAVVGGATCGELSARLRAGRRAWRAAPRSRG